jgi:branched-chain amino acid transport system substrate-binding protein
MTAGKYRDVNARSLMMSRRELSRSKRRAGTIAIAALPLVMVAACSSSNSSGNSSASSGGSASPVKIGTVLPLAGELASTGLGCQAGIEAAINTVNAKGGAGGHKIELSQVNDNFEVPQTIAGAKQLAQQDGVVGIIGPAGTSAAAAIPPVADALSVPFVGPYGFTSQLYKPVHPYVFALWPGTDAATQSMTEWGIKQNKATSVAVIANNGEVGDETFAGVQAAAKAEGIPVVAEARADNGATDYTGVLAQVAAKHPSILVIQAAAATIGQEAVDAHRVGLNVPVYGGFGAADGEIAKAGGKDAEGVYGLAPLSMSPSSPGWSTYAASVQAQGSQLPTSPVVGACNVSASVLIQAIADVPAGQSVTPASVVTALQGHTFNTLAGPVSFTASDHLGSKQLFVTQVQGGKVVTTSTELPVTDSPQG